MAELFQSFNLCSVSILLRTRSDTAKPTVEVLSTRRLNDGWGCSARVGEIGGGGDKHDEDDAEGAGSEAEKAEDEEEDEADEDGGDDDTEETKEEVDGDGGKDDTLCFLLFWFSDTGSVD